MMNHLQVTLDCDAHKIDLNAIYWGPKKGLTDQDNAQPLAKRSGLVDVAESHSECYNQEKTAVKIEHVLVEYQQQYCFLCWFEAITS